MVEEVTEQYTDKPQFVEGFALTGEEVINSQSQEFEIKEEPYYVEFQDGDKAKRKLVLTIQFNGALVTYYPNKSSIGKIIKEKGRRLSDWIGFTGEFEVLSQKIGGETKSVIYIK